MILTLVRVVLRADKLNTVASVGLGWYKVVAWGPGVGTVVGGLGRNV